MKYLILIAVFLFLPSCVTVKAPVQCTTNGEASLACDKISSPKPGYALVYIYRPNYFFQGGAWPDIWIDSYEIGPLRNHAFFTISLKPGTHNLLAKRTSKWENWIIPDFNASFNFEEGQTYYLQVAPKLERISGGVAISVSGSGAMAIVGGVTAEKELKQAKYLGGATYE